MLSSSFQLFSLQFVAIIFADPMTCFQIVGQKVGNSFFIKLSGDIVLGTGLMLIQSLKLTASSTLKNGWQRFRWFQFLLAFGLFLFEANSLAGCSFQGSKFYIDWFHLKRIHPHQNLTCKSWGAKELNLEMGGKPSWSLPPWRKPMENPMEAAWMVGVF